MDLTAFLSRVLYEVIEKRVSVDVAFKRVCRGRCAKSLEDREHLYVMCRKLISDYMRLTCLAGSRRRVSYRSLVRLWLSGFSSPPGLLRPSCRLSVSEWLYGRVASTLGEQGAEELFKAFEERVWWLRVNTFKGSEEAVIRELEAEGVDVEVNDRLPYMLRVLRSPKPVRLLRPVKEFKAVPQDLASAISVEFLEVEPGDLVVDMCAAPGLKTSLIAMLSGGEANIVAVDVSRRRILAMRYLLRKMGVPEQRIHLLLADSKHIKLERPADKALLDAPCSNSGAIDKDPGIKATLTSGKVEYYSKEQVSLLRKAFEISGCVVYTTCSLLPEEGEEVVTRVLREVPAIPILPGKFREFCYPGYPGYELSKHFCRLFPHTHRSEGFFISRLYIV